MKFAIDPGVNSILRDLPVLVVEDDDSNSKLMLVILRGEGCNVKAVRSGEDALKLLHTFRPSVILVDLILPTMSGMTLIQLLKSDPATRDIVLIAVTVINGPETERMTREAGCAAYVRKPFNPMTLANVLADQLSAGGK